MILNDFLQLSPEDRIKVLYSTIPYSLDLLYKIAIDNLEDRKDDWIMPDIHKQWLSKICSNNRHETIFAPRGFAKSSVLKIGILDMILTQRIQYCIYVSATFEQSNDQVSGLAKILNDPRLQVLCKYKILNHNQKLIEIQFSNGKKAQIEAVTAGGSIRGKNYDGKRPEIIAIDDIEEDKTAYSVTLTDKLERWMLNTLIPSTGSPTDGLIRYIGTIICNNALGSRIKNNIESKNGSNLYEDYNVQTYKALENGKSLWESKFKTTALLELKQRQPRMFAAEYENEPMEETSGVITRDMLNYYDNEHFDLSTIKEAWCHFDLNVTQTEKSDYFAGIVLGRDSENKVYILDIIYTKPTIEQQADIIINTWIKWSVISPLREITIDGVAYQRTLKTWIDKEARTKGVYINIRAIQYNKDKFNHFIVHEPLFTSRSVYIPNTHPNRHDLLNELLSFPSSHHDDLIDCFAFTADNMLNKQVVGFKRNQTTQIVTKL